MHPARVETGWLAERLGQPGLLIVDCTVQHYADPSLPLVVSAS